MRPQNTESNTCFMLPEMVDVGVDAMAEEKDLRAVVARRLAETLHAEGQPERQPAWPVQPGSLAEAVYWYRRISGQSDHSGPEDVIVALSNLGYTWRTLGRWAESESAFRECLQLQRQHGDRAGEAQSLTDLASLHQAQGRLLEARSALAQALEISRELGDRRRTVNALRHLGVVAASLGEHALAIGYHEQHLALARELGDHRREIHALAHLGEAYVATAQPDKAAACFQQALAAAQAHGDESLAQRMRDRLARILSS